MTKTAKIKTILVTIHELWPPRQNQLTFVQQEHYKKLKTIFKINWIIRKEKEADLYHCCTPFKNTCWC